MTSSALPKKSDQERRGGSNFPLAIRSKSIFGLKIENKFLPYDGKDYSKYCAVFPGQGSAYPGMFHQQYESETAFAEVFERIDQIAKDEKIPLPSQYLLGNFRSEKSIEVVLQRLLALFGCEVALYRSLISIAPCPFALTGFSFGEFAAQVASEMVSLEDMTRLIILRERACPPPFSFAGMLAIGAAPERIRDLLDKNDFYVSNVCSPELTVISLLKSSLKNTIRRCKKHDLAAIPLKEVPQAYHSPFLREAAEKLSRHVEQLAVELSMPKVPIFSSVLHRFINKDDDLKELFKIIATDHLTEPVNFIGQLEGVSSAGCCTFVEVGPGQVCSRFVSETLKATEPKIYSVDDFIAQRKKVKHTALAAELNLSNSRFLKPLLKAIARVTGYELDSVAIERNFQIDLGIDSIKKSEIVFSVMEEAEFAQNSPVNISEIKTLADALRSLDRAEKSNANSIKDVVWRPHFERFATTLVEQSLNRLGELRMFSGEQISAETVTPKSEYFNLTTISTSCSGFGERVVVMRENANLRNLMNSIGDQYENGYGVEIGRLLYDLQLLLKRLCAIAQTQTLNYKLILISYSESPREYRALAPAIKSFCKEDTRFSFRHIHFDSTFNEMSLDFSLKDEIQFGLEQEVVISKDGQRFVVKHEVQNDVASPELRPEIIVVFGGSGGIATSLLRRVLQQRVRALAIVGRKDRSYDEAWNALNLSKDQVENFHYFTCDASDRSQIDHIFSELCVTYGRIDIVLNAIGVEVSKGFLSKDAAEIYSEVQNKLLPALLIHCLADKYRVCRIIHFSSVVSMFGNEGQVVYAFNSRMVDLLVCENRLSFEAGAQSILWPPWDGVGMTKAPAIRRHLQSLGVSLLSEDDAAELFAADLMSSRSGCLSYITSKDIQAYSMKGMDWKSMEPYLGVFDGFRSFQRAYSLAKDSYLSHHKVAGLAYVPAAFYLAQALLMCTQLFSGSSAVASFCVMNPLIVSDEQTMFVEIDQRREGVEVKGRTNIPHFSCKLIERTIEEGILGTNLVEGGDASPLCQSDIYGPQALFHGLTFQVLRSASISTEGSLAKMVSYLNLPSITGVPIFDRLVQIIDGAFQTVALCVLQETGEMALPVGVDLLQFNMAGGDGKTVSYRISSLRRDSANYQCDLEVFSAEKLVGKMNQITVAAVSSSLAN